MNEAYFSYKELVHLAGSPEIFIVVCTKFLSLPNGSSGYLYQLQSETGELLRDEKGNTWYSQNQLKKLHQPGTMDFKTLMDHLKNDILQEDDFE